MGVQFDRILEPFTGPFEKVGPWNVAPPRGRIAVRAGPGGFVTSGAANDAFVLANRLLKRGEAVSRLTTPVTVNGAVMPAGSFVFPGRPASDTAFWNGVGRLGLHVEAMPSPGAGATTALRGRRIGLWDQYGGSMPSGWTRWILEQFEFPFERVFAPALDAGNLNQRFDALVFVTGAIPGAGGGRGGGRGGRGGGGAADTPPEGLPAEYRGHFGRITAERTLPQLRTFIENGGTVIAIGSSAVNLAAFLQLPLENHLTANGTPLTNTQLYVPGSVLRARVDSTHAAAYGMQTHTDFFFDDSPVFRLGASADARGVKRIAWFDTSAPLRSGWAWGQQHLEGGAIAVEAKVGRGRVLLYAAEILQRAQPHGTFKLLFNGLF